MALHFGDYRLNSSQIPFCLYTQSSSDPLPNSSYSFPTEYYRLRDLEFLFLDKEPGYLLQQSRVHFLNLWASEFNIHILKESDGEILMIRTKVEELAKKLGFSDLANFCSLSPNQLVDGVADDFLSTFGQKIAINRPYDEYTLLLEVEIEPKDRITSKETSSPEGTERAQLINQVHSGTTSGMATRSNSTMIVTKSPESDENDIIRKISDSNEDDIDHSSDEKKKRKRLSINTSSSLRSDELQQTLNISDSGTPESGSFKFPVKRKLSEKRGSIHNLTIQPPNHSQQLEQQSIKSNNSQAVSATQTTFSPQNIKLGPPQRRLMGQAGVPAPTGVQTFSQPSSLLNPNTRSQNSQQLNSATPITSHSTPTTTHATPTTTHATSTTSHATPEVLRSAFISTFEQIYDQIEETNTLQSTLKEQIRKSAALLQTLQASGNMIEGLVRNHFGVMQQTYGEKFGTALTHLNRRLLIVEEKLGMQGTNIHEKEKSTLRPNILNSPSVGLAPPVLGPGGAPFSANGRFHGPGPLSAMAGGGSGGLFAGGVAEQMLKSVIDRLELIEKKTSSE
ncbi:hypothetical protein HK096_004057 [Nowakowskiella sp. JEL0078]|nr:hypothetical protein HK096_004057 [Nowakowskiella sp. JEL0078]